MENIFNYYDYYHSRYWHDENHRKIKDIRMYEILLHRIVGRMILEDMNEGYERLSDSDNLVSIIKKMFLEDTNHLSIFCMRDQEIIHSLLNKVICDERFNGEKKDDDEIR